MPPTRSGIPTERGVMSLIEDLAKPSASMDSQAVAELTKLALALEDFLDSEVARLVQSAGEQPVLQYYSSDGTPSKLT